MPRRIFPILVACRPPSEATAMPPGLGRRIPPAHPMGAACAPSGAASVARVTHQLQFGWLGWASGSSWFWTCTRPRTDLWISHPALEAQGHVGPTTILVKCAAGKVTAR